MTQFELNAYVEVPSEIPQEDVTFIDPSDFRTEEKHESKFRNFTNSVLQERVENTYKNMHTYQTVDFVKRMKEKWCKFDHSKMTILQVLKSLDVLIDESDPDANFGNSYHAFQTAERIRENHPDKEWLIVTGLIHDLGKLMALYGEEQWAVVGDTFPVGCKPSDAVVFGKASFVDNEDVNNSQYNTELGMYSEKCGLENLVMSWGHDEYLYQVLKFNGHNLPEEALNIIRYHSFYPWHTSQGYRQFHKSPEDDVILDWVLEFNKYDLYSKSEDLPDVAELMPYYQELVEKFVPGILSW